MNDSRICMTQIVEIRKIKSKKALLQPPPSRLFVGFAPSQEGNDGPQERNDGPPKRDEFPRSPSPGHHSQCHHDKCKRQQSNRTRSTLELFLWRCCLNLRFLLGFGFIAFVFEIRAMSLPALLQLIGIQQQHPGPHVVLEEIGVFCRMETLCEKPLDEALLKEMQNGGQHLGLMSFDVNLEIADRPQRTASSPLPFSQ